MDWPKSVLELPSASLARIGETENINERSMDRHFGEFDIVASGRWVHIIFVIIRKEWASWKQHGMGLLWKTMERVFVWELLFC